MTLLPDAEVAEDDVQELLNPHATGNTPQGTQGEPEILGSERDLGCDERAC